MGKMIISEDRFGPYLSLRKLYDQNIHVNHISEPIYCFSKYDDIAAIKDFMTERSYDVVGIEENGIVIGYIDRHTVTGMKTSDAMHHFSPTDIVSESTPLIQVLYLFKETNRIFVLEGNKVTKLVTLADLQKPPIRMLLFGLTTLLEMHLLRLIRNVYPLDIWKDHLSDDRVNKAVELYQDRKMKNEEIELSDCLQLCDKKMLVKKSRELRTLLHFPSKSKTEKFFNDLESLRNNLAHAQQLDKSWEETIALVETCEELLKICEVKSI